MKTLSGWLHPSHDRFLGGNETPQDTLPPKDNFPVRCRSNAGGRISRMHQSWPSCSIVLITLRRLQSSGTPNMPDRPFRFPTTVSPHSGTTLRACIPVQRQRSPSPLSRCCCTWAKTLKPKARERPRPKASGLWRVGS